MTESATFLTPVGRIVQGNLYKGQTVDAEGKPLVIKNGPNAGQPRVDFYFAVAIPKGAEPHWSHTPWGQVISTVAEKSFPGGQTRIPSFAWKIVDGDSNIPNRKGRKPCDREGYKGCWVISFSSGFAPKIFNRDGSAPIQEVDAVKPGYYVQVHATVKGNGSQQQPGVLLNHNMVAFAGYGPEIVFGPDPTAVGFGAAPLPAGVSATPVAGMAAPPATVAPRTTVTGVTPQTTVTPHTAFLGGAVAPPPPAPPVAPQRQMTAKAQGATYEALIAAGWNDALLVQHGMMVA